ESLEGGDGRCSLVVDGGVGDREGALEGLGGGGVVAWVDAEQTHPVGGVVLVNGPQVPGLGAARWAGGVPEVDHHHLPAPLAQVDLLAVVGLPEEVDRSEERRVGKDGGS